MSQGSQRIQYSSNNKTKKFRGGADPIEGSQQPPAAGTPIEGSQQPPAAEIPIEEAQQPPAAGTPIEEAQQPPAADEMPIEEAQQPPAADETPIEEAQPPPAADETPIEEAQPPADETPIEEAQPPAVDEMPIEESQQPPAADIPVEETPIEESPENVQLESSMEEQPEMEGVGMEEGPKGNTDEIEATEIEEFRKRVQEYEQDYLFLNTSISTEPNKDKTYKREGVLHFTDSVTTTGDQKTVLSLGGVIGDKGIENSTYDKLRNVALKKVDILLGENRRCYNTHLNFERNGNTILVHIYGTLYAKKSS